MSDKFKKLIDRRLEDLRMDDTRKAEILKLARELSAGNETFKQEKTGGKKSLRPVLVLPLAVCLCLLFSIAVVAAVPQLRERFFHLISPQYEEFAPPVIPAEQSKTEENNTEDDKQADDKQADDKQADNKQADNKQAGQSADSGLKLEATKAVTDGKTMIIYFQIQDTEGRMDDSIDVYDYSVNGFTFLNCSQIGFDSSTNTAKFCILASGGERPEEGNVKLSITSLMTDSRRYEDFNTGIAVRDILQEETAGQEAVYFGGGGDREMMEQLGRQGDTRTVHVLETGGLSVPFRSDIDFVKISNAGFLDGYLHIQTKWEASVDNHGDVYLLDDKGNRIPSVSLDFAEGDGMADRDSEENKYIEYVYDLRGVSLDTCTLNAFFVEDGEMLTGGWSEEFSVSSVENQSIQAEGRGLAEEAVITPLGICLYDTLLEGGDIEEIVITEMDGSSRAIAARFTDHDGDKKNLILVAEAPLELETLKSVAINGKILYEAGRQQK